MENLPLETFGVLGQFLILKDILSLATTNKEFHDAFLTSHVNKQLADYFGFPYGLSLVELKKYEELNYNHRFVEAAKIGDIRIVKRMIEFGASFYTRAFYEAVMNNQKEIEEFLISVGGINFGTTIYHAARNNNLEAFKKIRKYHRDSIHNNLSNASDDFIQALKEAISIKMVYYDDENNTQRNIIFLLVKEYKKICKAKGIQCDLTNELWEADDLGLMELKKSIEQFLEESP